MTKEQILEALRQVIDPELGVNIVDLGLVYDVRCGDGGDVVVRMTLTTPGCPMHDSIAWWAEKRLSDLPGVRSARVDVVWDPPWTPERMSPEAKRMLGMADA